MEYLDLNRRLSQQWPLIVAAQDPLPDADAWADWTNKRAALLETD